MASNFGAIPMQDELDRHHRSLFERRRRVRKLLRPLPRRANVRRYPIIKWFAELARKRPYLWSFKRANVLPALYVGAILSLLPLYGLQAGLALLAAVLVRGNLTVMVGLQFLTNPFTIGPIYYFTYRIGFWLIEATGMGEGIAGWGTRVNALFLGGLVAGVTLAFAVDLLWRFAAWEARLFRRRLNALRQQVDAAKAGSAVAPRL